MKDEKGIEGSGCFVGQELVRGEPCLLGDALQQFHRGRMNTANDVADGRLAHTDTPRKFHLGGLRAFKPCVEGLHRVALSEFPIAEAIGPPAMEQMIINIVLGLVALVCIALIWAAWKDS